MRQWVKNFKKAAMIGIIGMVLLLGCVFQSQAYANSMESLDFHVELQVDGSGVVTETRKMHLTEDTEIYIKMENLGGSEISDFQVSDFGKPLTYEENWDIEAGRAEKSGKYGIVETDQGYELCWGIGEYGDHEYGVTYTISNMVRQLQDGQGMNWRLFDGEGNINPASLTITIDGPEPFTSENTKIWGFGFTGEIYLENGSLVGWSKEPLSDNNYVTILMQFAHEPFQPLLSMEQTLGEQENIAKEGSSYNQNQGDNSLSFGEKAAGIVVGIVGALSAIFSVIGIASRSRAIKRANPLIKGKERRKLNEDQYYREIPYGSGPITDVAYMLELVERGRIEDYFNAYLLKWLKEGNIDHITEEKGLIFKKEQSILQLNRPQIKGRDFESRLWNMMQAAAGEDNKLEEKEFTKWAKKNYEKIRDLKEELSSNSKSFLIREEFLKKKKVPVLKFFTSTVMCSTEQGESLFNHLVQFENYLRDFSLLNERVPKEVLLWDELLIWASLYDIAEEVAQQFEKLYPQFLEESQYTAGDFYMMTMFTNSFAKGYHSGLSSASSGGGGSTSMGGGGGSFGGGGGGSR